ncbi:uncharacterized protein EDB91DRAFT_1240212 [Suillus paluster]|uniref:uncharacterized protein n=1 Tax=Suillus paluster TaxID=48578 RepID=UPI001B85F23C|nr:uncharacterized protein EDB91DRAFT_1240212 [Suillus paluster]KAG1722488.1 hypothetical protein EDB91DRAFT_1240212 [Suillus paluster]
MPTISSAQGLTKKNDSMKEKHWTDDERQSFIKTLGAFARWEVDYANFDICSPHYEGKTMEPGKICKACQAKEAEAKLPLNIQHEKQLTHGKFTPHNLSSAKTHDLQDKLNDPIVFDAAWEGKLSKSQTFVDICSVFEEKLQCGSSSNLNSKFGYGRNSARQYSILQSQIGGPSMSLVTKSEDALQNPDLIFENVVHVKWLLDIVKYDGPMSVGSDCMKVHARLSYSQDFGSHILGSVLHMDQCEVNDADDIEVVINCVKEAKAMATQVQAVIVKPAIPETPTIVVALLATDGRDTGDKIHELQMLFLRMAARLSLKVVTFSADGAASKLAAQALMDGKVSLEEPLKYNYPLYRKTSCNQSQHGTHTVSLGIGYVVNRSLNVNKQDDGAARRIYLYEALAATCEMKDGKMEIQKGFEGLFFVKHFFGLTQMFLPNFAYAELVKMVQTIMLQQKILMMQKFQEGRKKDSAAGYSFTYDPSPLTDDHLHTTSSQLTAQQLNGIVEVTYRKAAQICKQILCIQVPVLANGKPFMLTPLRAPRVLNNCQHEAPDDNNGTDLDNFDNMTAESAAREVTAYSALCDDLEEAMKDSQAVLASSTSSSSLPSSAPKISLTHCETPNTIHVEDKIVAMSSILDKDEMVSITLMLKAHIGCQSKATVHSERIVLLDPKFTVLQLMRHLAILQKQDSSFAPVKTARELLWKQVSSAIARVIQPQDDDMDVSSDAVPSFSRLPSRYQYEIHTHAPASSILYHIGKRALKGTNTWALELSNANARHWVALTAPQVKQKLPRLKISGSKITKV